MEELLKKRKEILWIRNSIFVGLIVLECMLIYQWKVNFLAVYNIGFSLVAIGGCIWAAKGLLYIDQLVFEDLKVFLKEKIENTKETSVFSVCAVDHWVDEYKVKHFKYPFVLNLLIDKEQSKLYQEVLQSIIWPIGDSQKSLWQISNLEYSKIAESMRKRKSDSYFFIQYLSLEDLSNALKYVDNLVLDLRMFLALKHRKEGEMSKFLFLCIEKEIQLIPDLSKDVLLNANLSFEILGYIVQYEGDKLDLFMGIKFRDLRKELLDLWLSLPEKDWSLFKHWKGNLPVEFTQKDIDDYGRYIRSL